ncbi:MAG: rod shape-determining protein RodA [Patescibacteria group bacterium]|nr:MAG: rod shape-determining protein RodA [Patescibacteria group bacterium]
MLQRTIQAYRKFDWLLFGSAVLLTGLGLLALYSIGLGADGDFGAFKKQLFFFALGLLIVAVGTVGFHYRWLSFVTVPMYFGMMLLLLTVLVTGQVIRGTRGWIYIGSAGFQPVELAKVVLIIIMAKFLATHGRYTKDIRVVIQSAVTVVLMLLLVVLQPDLGGAIILASIWFGMVLVSGLRAKHLLTMAAIAIAFGAVSWLFLLRPYQKERIATFLNPASDPFGQGYNVTQSVIAIGAGQLTGRGVASGSQSQLRFLPEAKTDFIFSVIAEEMGFIGVLILLGLFGVLFSRLYVLAATSRDDFTLFLVIGTSVLIASETFVNIGVASGILPVTGLALPFVSYGGTSLVMHFVLIALMQNIAVRRS